MTSIQNFGKLTATILLCLLAVTAGWTQQAYQVTIDTSPLNGQTGYLDLQFNPGGLGALAASITVDQVVTDGSLASVATNSGGATGALPGPPAATIANTTQYNDLFQGITFGNQISFNATFTGAALTPTLPLPAFGSTFAVSLYDATGATPLETTGADGSMLHLDINPDGTTAATLFADSGGTFRATATLLSSGVPESGTVFSLVIGFSMLGFTWRTRRCALSFGGIKGRNAGIHPTH